MTDCKVCWGTGFYHGLGAPCKEGCKPPTKKHGLAAVTNSDAAVKEDWSTSLDLGFRPHKTTVEECRKAVKEAKKFYQSDTTAEECREAVKKFMQTTDPETGED